MDRVLRDTAATASVLFTEDGATVDPGVVTVTITREDGTVIETDEATGGSGAAARTFALTTHLDALDVLKLDWFSATKGTLTTYIEVVGGFLFTIAEARLISPLGNTTTYSVASLRTARTLAETALEEACGVAFTPRYAREKLDGNGATDLLLPAPRPLSVESATIDGTAITVGDLELYPEGVLYYSGGWTAGRRNVEIKYTKGYAQTPPRVGRACLLLAKRFLVDSPLSDRLVSLTNEVGATQTLITAGVRQAVFDVPEANAIVEEYGYSRGVA